MCVFWTRIMKQKTSNKFLFENQIKWNSGHRQSGTIRSQIRSILNLFWWHVCEWTWNNSAGWYQSILIMPYFRNHSNTLGSIKAVTMFDSIESGWIFTMFLQWSTLLFFIRSRMRRLRYWVTVMYTQRNQTNKTTCTQTCTRKLSENKKYGVCMCVFDDFTVLFTHTNCAPIRNMSFRCTHVNAPVDSTVYRMVEPFAWKSACQIHARLTATPFPSILCGLLFGTFYFHMVCSIIWCVCI